MQRYKKMVRQNRIVDELQHH
uniref:Uncharacterized protein n=1 Tax=Anguilla anguilla TaxID=7936 RepID=A0A0E9T8G1_ANGAN